MMAFITHLSIFAVGILIGGAVVSRHSRKARVLAELRGLRARLITLSPEEAARHAEGR